MERPGGGRSPLAAGITDRWWRFPARGRPRLMLGAAVDRQLAAPVGDLENTNFPIGPSRGLSASGRHRIVSSILRASVKSLSVIPPAEWVASLTQSLPQVTFRSA